MILNQNISQFKKLKVELKAGFCITDRGKVLYYLGRTIDMNPNKAEIRLKQTEYLKKILQRFNIQNSRPMSTSMEQEVGNLLYPSNKQANEDTTILYQSVIKSLMWASMDTCPDLAYSVGVLNRYYCNPGKTYYNLLQRVLKYIAGSFSLSLIFRKDSAEDPIGYLDSDYAGPIDRKKSTEADVFMFAGGAISQSSKLQPTVYLVYQVLRKSIWPWLKQERRQYGALVSLQNLDTEVQTRLFYFAQTIQDPSHCQKTRSFINGRNISRSSDTGLGKLWNQVKLKLNTSPQKKS